MSIEKQFNFLKFHPSDINEHLEKLYNEAKNYKKICEFGVRTGVSTIALLKSLLDNPDSMIESYDIEFHQNMNQIIDIVNKENLTSRFKLNINSVLDIDPVKCDMLFIDTLHTYNQLSNELKIHVESNPNAPKCLIFHDVELFGLRDEITGLAGGLLPAIIEFLSRNKHWYIDYYTRNNNGLMVLKR